MGDIAAAVITWSGGDGKIISQEMEDRCSIPINIRGKQTRAMLDTGSSVNYLTEAIIDELKLRHLMRPKGMRKVVNVAGEQIEIEGELSLLIVISDIPVWTTCVVTDKLPIPVILSRPFMRQTNVKLDVGQDTLQLNDSIASISFPKVPATPVTDKVLTFYPNDDVTIQANSESLVQCGLVVHEPLLNDE